ncbi:diaminopimelate decarboxylase family protein [Streptomyces sp. NPDC004752]
MSESSAFADPVSGYGHDALSPVLTTTDSLSVAVDGCLMVEGRRADELVKEFGSPLYVLSERTLRANYRRVARAMAAAWPVKSKILYAIKANNNLAVRAIFHQEGAGGDCFGEGELYATFLGGATPDSVVLNGSNKNPRDLRAAAELGLVINIDGEDEIDFLREIARELGRSVRVCLRLRAIPAEFTDRTPDYIDSAGRSLAEKIEGAQWGFSVESAARLIPAIMNTPGLDLLGYHHHLGRLLPDLDYNTAWARELVGSIGLLEKHTGFVPRLLNIGGGFARERDPESRNRELNPNRVEDHIRAVTRELIAGLNGLGFPLPELWVEPGRYLVGNAGVLLGTVGQIKRDLGRIWVNADFSINNLMRIETSGSNYHVLAANRLRTPAVEPVTVVGPLCTGSPISRERPMPELKRGDILAVLDAGMYAETASTQFNGVPRPCTVLVNGDRVDVIKERESVLDVFAQHRVPPRLRAVPHRPQSEIEPEPENDRETDNA